MSATAKSSPTPEARDGEAGERMELTRDHIRAARMKQEESRHVLQQKLKISGNNRIIPRPETQFMPAGASSSSRSQPMSATAKSLPVAKVSGQMGVIPPAPEGIPQDLHICAHKKAEKAYLELFQRIMSNGLLYLSAVQSMPATAESSPSSECTLSNTQPMRVESQFTPAGASSSSSAQPMSATAESSPSAERTLSNTQPIRVESHFAPAGASSSSSAQSMSATAESSPSPERTLSNTQPMRVESQLMSAAASFMSARASSSSSAHPMPTTAKSSPAPEGLFIWQPDSRNFFSTHTVLVSQEWTESERVNVKAMIQSSKDGEKKGDKSLKKAQGEFKVSLKIKKNDEDKKLNDTSPLYLNVHVERRTSTGWESVYHEPKLQIDLNQSILTLNKIIDIKIDGKVTDDMKMKITISQSESE